MTGFNDRIAALADRVDKIKSGKYRLSQVGIVEKEAVPLLREMAQALSEAKAENVGLKGQFLDHAETDSYLRMVKYAAHVKDLYRWEKEQKEAVQAENDRLRADYQTSLHALALSRQQVYELEDKLNASAT